MVFFDLLSKSILYSGIINFSLDKMSILNEYFFKYIRFVPIPDLFEYSLQFKIKRKA